MIDPAYVTQILINGVLMGLLYSLVALGLALIFGVMDIINFAHGDFVMLGAYLTFLIATYFLIDPTVTIALTVPLFFLLGIAVYKAIIKPVLGAEPLIQIAVTVGLLMFLRNLALAIFHAEPRGVPYTVFSTPITIGPITIPLSRAAAGAVSLAVLYIVHLLLTRTRWGIAVRATADDREAAALMGINVERVYYTTFGLGTALTALAAALIMTFSRADPYLGLLYGLLSWVIVAMGGLGGVVGVLASGLILGIIESFGMSLISAGARELFLYVTFLVVLWVRPRGLFGRR
ncbi:MAG: branched-chain amino acid ABC transporter permease [Desulfurococcales archaeon ex4484_204]|nr:MAG: branched-chain amino acid ABC transporter permease [Desulfurococcales archaeon ex4484_204]